MRKPTGLDVLTLIVIAAIWGSAFFAIKIGVEGGLAPLTLAATRITVAALALLVYAFFRGHALPRNGREWHGIFWVGVLSLALPFFLISWAEQEISSGLAAILMAMGPLYALVLAHFLTENDRFTGTKLLAVALGFAGVLVVIGIDPFRELGLELWAQLAVIAASLCYVSSGVIVARLKNVSPTVITTGAATISAGLMIPLSLIIDRPWTLAPSADALYAALYLGLFPTALAFLMRFHMIAAVGVSFFALVGYIIPVFGVLWGALFLSEVVPMESLLGLGLILIGIKVGQHGQRGPKDIAKDIQP